MSHPCLHAVEICPKDAFEHILDGRLGCELELVTGFASLFDCFGLHPAPKVVNGAQFRGGTGARTKYLNA